MLRLCIVSFLRIGNACWHRCEGFSMGVKCLDIYEVQVIGPSHSTQFWPLGISEFITHDSHPLKSRIAQRSQIYVGQSLVN